MNDRDRAALTARAWLTSPNVVFLDTETTGFGRSARVCEIAILDAAGSSILQTLVNPGLPIPASATAVHGITDADVAQENTMHALDTLAAAFLLGAPVVTYNADFDYHMLLQSGGNLTAAAPAHWYCAMKLYAAFRGERGRRRSNWKWHTLTAAGQQCGLVLPPHLHQLHRAHADAELCRQLVQHMAAQVPAGNPD